MVIAARFESVCPNCSQRITAGSSVNWSKGSKATHVTCPQTSVIDLGSEWNQDWTNQTELLCAIVNGDAPGNVRAAQAALDMIEDKLFSQYEVFKAFAIKEETR